MFELIPNNLLAMTKEDFNVDDEFLGPAFEEGKSYLFRLVEVMPIELNGVYKDEVVYMAINEFNCEHYLSYDEVKELFIILTMDVKL